MYAGANGLDGVPRGDFWQNNQGNNFGAVTLGDQATSGYKYPAEWSVFGIPPNPNLKYKNFQYPKAHEGEAQLLANIITSSLIANNLSFILSANAGLPIVSVDQQYFTWTEIHMDIPWLTIVPEEGVSDTFRGSYEEHHATLVRRGVSLYVEDGFMNTPMGRQYLMLGLQRMETGTMYTYEMVALNAMLSCRGQHYEKLKAELFTPREYRQMCKLWSINFDCAQKNEEALSNLVIKMKEVLNKKRGFPANGMYVQTRGYSYLGFNGAKRLDYMLAGPEGPNRVNQNPWEIDTFVGTPVYYLEDFKDGEDILYPLDRIRQFGHYYMIHGDDPVSIDPKNYSSHMMSIDVIDLDRERYARISVLDALNHCRAFGPKTGPGGQYPWGSDTRNDKDHFLGGGGQFEGENSLLLSEVDASGRAIYATMLGEIQQKHLPNDYLLSMCKTMMEKFAQPGDDANAKAGRAITKIVQDLFKQDAFDPSVNSEKIIPLNMLLYANPDGIISFIEKLYKNQVIPQGELEATIGNQNSVRGRVLGWTPAGQPVVEHVRKTIHDLKTNGGKYASIFRDIFQQDYTVAVTRANFEADVNNIDYGAIFALPQNDPDRNLWIGAIVKTATIPTTYGIPVAGRGFPAGSARAPAADGTMTNDEHRLLGMLASKIETELNHPDAARVLSHLENSPMEHDLGEGTHYFAEVKVVPGVSAPTSSVDFDSQAVKQMHDFNKTMLTDKFEEKFGLSKNAYINLANEKTFDKTARAAFIQDVHSRLNTGNDEAFKSLALDVNSIIATGDKVKDAFHGKYAGPSSAGAPSVSSTKQYVVSGIKKLSGRVSVLMERDRGLVPVTIDGEIQTKPVTWFKDLKNIPAGEPFEINSIRASSVFRARVGLDHTNMVRTAADIVANEEYRGIGNVQMSKLFRYLCAVPLTKGNMRWFIDNDIPFPFGFLIAQPFVQCMMASILLGHFGRDLGFFAQGPSKMMWGPDVAKHTHSLSYITNGGPIIHRPECLAPIDDVWCKEYIGGMNGTFFDKESWEDVKMGQFRVQAREGAPSLISFIVPVNFHRKIDTIIDIRGKFSTDSPKDMLHFDTVGYAHQQYGFPSNEDSQDFMSATEAKTNTVLFQGHQREWSHKSNSYAMVNIGNSPFGVNCYPKMRSVLDGNNGQYNIFKDLGFEKLGVEAFT